MGELGQNARNRRQKPKIGRTCLVVEPVSEAILAGLPADVMDELVEDMAEAVVAILLHEAAAKPDEEDDASGDLRKV